MVTDSKDTSVGVELEYVPIKTRRNSTTDDLPNYDDDHFTRLTMQQQNINDSFEERPSSAQSQSSQSEMNGTVTTAYSSEKGCDSHKGKNTKQNYNKVHSQFFYNNQETESESECSNEDEESVI